MKPFLRACWLASANGAPDPAALKAYADAIGASQEAGPSAAYQLVERPSVLASIRDKMQEVDRDSYPVLPDSLVLTELDSVDAAMRLEEQLQQQAADHAEKGLQTIVRGIYCEITYTQGTEPELDTPFGPVIQLGTFNMASSDDEWAVTEWYRHRRLPSFAKIKGGFRARRFVSACGGPAKLAVLYEFTSLEERAEHFDPLESVDHDEARPTAAARTIHPPMSPSIGTAVSLG